MQTALSNVFRVAERFDQPINNAVDEIDAGIERWQNRMALERLSFSERYAIGRTDIGFLFAVNHSIAHGGVGAVVGGALEQLNFVLVRMRKAENAHRGGKFDGWTAGDDGSQQCFVKIQNLSGQNQKPMFISGVETVYPAEKWMPVSVWLQLVNVLNDFCAGELYLSAFDLSYKALFFPDKGKHEFMGIGRPVARHGIDRQVKGGPQVVDCVSDYQRPGIWNLSESFGNDQILVGLRPMFDDEPKWPVIHEFFDGAPKLVDMVLSPPNL